MSEEFKSNKLGDDDIVNNMDIEHKDAMPHFNQNDATESVSEQDDRSVDNINLEANKEVTNEITQEINKEVNQEVIHDYNTAQSNEQSFNHVGNTVQMNSQPPYSNPGQLNAQPPYSNPGQLNAQPPYGNQVQMNTQPPYGNQGQMNAQPVYGYPGPVNAQPPFGNQYQGYPIPQIHLKKVKKKRKVPGALKLTAAALAFGIIAAVSFQGFYYIMDATGNSFENDSDQDVKVTQVTQAAGDNDTIVPAAETSGDSVVTDVSDIVEKAMPSIVVINANVTTTASDFFGRSYSQEAQSSGSGIIIAQNDSQLLIVTNNHVIDGASSVEIVFADGKEATAEIKGADSGADLAVLSVDMKDLTEVTIKAIKVATLGDSDTVQAGDMAIAIGNALGYGQSVTVGYISAVNREITLEDKTMTLLQTDAAINPGNSGGALLNTQGQVIGINSVKYASTDVEGMGYAIPISTAIPMIDELMNRQVVVAGEQGYLGINASTAENVTSDYAERFNMPVGVYVNDVIEDSPAENAGLIRGDIIVGVDSIKVETIDDLINVLSFKKSGEEITLKIETKESGAYTEKTLNITLGHK
jgi:serine protease Do